MSLRRLLWAGLALVILSFAEGCSRPAPPPAVKPPADAPDVIAQVDGEPITAKQFQEGLVRRRVGTDPVARRALLDEMIRFRAGVQEAKRRGLDHDPEMIAAWERILVGKVRADDRAKAAARSEITPEQVAADYQAHPERYTRPARVRAAEIFVEAPATFSAEKRAERRADIAAAREKALALGPEVPGFGPLAAEISYDQTTKYRGGDLGYLVEGMTDGVVEKPVSDAIFALRNPGEISGIIETPQGFYVTRLMERQNGGVRPLDEVRNSIAARLAREEQQGRQRALDEAVLAGHKVQVNAARLAEVPAPSEAPVQAGDAPPPPGLPGE